MASQMNSTEYLKNNNKLNKLFRKIKEKEILPNSFYEHSITNIPEPDANITRKLQINIPIDPKVFNKILAS